MRKTILLAGAVFMLGASALGYVNRETLAPLFIPKGQCGPLQLRLDYSDNTAGHGGVFKSFPVSAGRASDSAYINAVVSNLILSLKKSRLTDASRTGPPFQLDVTMVTDLNDAGSTDRYDRFGSTNRFDSPWLRVNGSAWLPCSMQVIFIRQGRQIARDQMEMLIGKPLSWADYGQLNNSEIRSLALRYRSERAAAGSRPHFDPAWNPRAASYPPDVYFAFENSAHTDLSAAEGSFWPFLMKNQSGYVEFVNNVTNLYFNNNNKKKKVRNIKETGLQIREYQFLDLKPTR